MSLSLTETYSGVVINQNQVVSDPLHYADGTGAWRQEFFLPADFRRGTETNELRYPGLSGFQLYVQIEDGYANTAAFEYTVEYQVLGVGWIKVTEGTAIGAPTDGSTWMTAYFSEPVEIDPVKATSRWRINFTGRSATGQPKDVLVDYTDGVANVYGNRVMATLADYEPWPFDFGGVPAFLYYDPADAQATFSYQQGIQKFWVSSPNPLALPNNVKGRWQTDIPLDLGGGAEGSFNFRILALTGDEGIDFLGNQYRSVVTRNQADQISTALGSDPDQFWLSKPNPSKFAVENLYFDVRKSTEGSHGVQNLVTNPSFELGSTGWSALLGATLSIGIDDPPSPWGAQSMLISTPGTQAHEGSRYAPAGGIPAAANQTFTASVGVMAEGFWNLQISIDPRDSSDVSLGAVAHNFSIPELGVWDHYSVTATMPIGTHHLYVNVQTSGTTFTQFSVDALMVTKTPAAVDYFDGDTDGHTWSGLAHASTSFEVLEPDISDTVSVIDRVLIDPITPGAYFNIYYSEDGLPGTSDASWENKLWSRVPQTYRMERRETHVLPEPIKAKYVKIEFSHLQAQHYAPGNFQQAIRYKKHPKWVLDYFLAQLSTAQGNPFIAQSVQVVYDALDLAYNYYLDDLGQEPQSTIDVNNTSTSTVTSFLSNRSDASDRIDPTTLDKISLVMNNFRLHPVLSGTTDTLLADYAKGTVSYNDDYPVEQNPPTALNLPDVSSLNRDAVVIEQNFPVMFFFLTCRHAYREVEAKFSHDRAYFVGVRELALLRDNYMTAFDTGTYIEPSADTQNIERNEFV